MIEAGLVANGGEPPKVKQWRSAQDASGLVVEMEMGWTKRLVFTLLHGDVKPKTVIQHGLMGSRRLR